MTLGAYKQQLLDELSTYDYATSLERQRKKRYGSTSAWLSKTPEYISWLQGDSSCFWLSGIIGSGKTVLTAAVIDELFYCEMPKGIPISFFFVQHDVAESLRAATILRSLIRQCLTIDNLPKDVEDELQHFFKDSSPDTNDLLLTMKRLSDRSLIRIIVIDGFDECPKFERDVVLKAMKHLMSSTGSLIKLFVSSRQQIGRDLDRHFAPYYQRTMSCSEVYTDIANYIRFSVADKIARKELSLGDPSLASEIIDVLIKGAHGM